MKYQGEFKNLRGDVVKVEIACHHVEGDDKSIGVEGDDVMFSDKAVTIDCEVNDTWDHLIQHSCTISLLVKHDMPEFFSADCRQVEVKVWKNGSLLFWGYIEPQSYQQEYNEIWDELELSCIDVLSSTSQHKYMDLTTSTYDGYVSSSRERRFIDIINGVLGVSDYEIWFDGSVSESSDEGKRWSIFSDLKIDDILFLGEEKDDLWSNQSVLKEIMQYLNVRMVQQGRRFFIYSYENVKKGGETCFKRIWPEGLSADEMLLGGADIEYDGDVLSSGFNGGEGMNISREEVSNVVKVVCDTKETDTVIENPLDKDSLTSRYTQAVKYCNELILEPQQDQKMIDAVELFLKLIATCQVLDADGGQKLTAWYMQLMEHPRWSCKSLYGFGGDNQQQDLINKGKWGAQFMTMGDNMKGMENDPFLAIRLDGEMPDRNHVFCEYVSANSTGNLTPSDKETTNYLCISGEVLLTARKDWNMTSWYITAVNPSSPSNPDTVFYREFVGVYNRMQSVPLAISAINKGVGKAYVEGDPLPQLPWLRGGSGSDEDEDQMKATYYTIRWVKTENGHNTEQDASVDMLIPPTDETVRTYPFDKVLNEKGVEVNRVKVLNMELIVGDKTLKQTLKEDGDVKYEWVAYDADNIQTFGMLINAEGKSLIGPWHSLTNDNAETALPFTDKGMLIPIKKSDRVRGKVTLRLRGGCQYSWNQAARTLMEMEYAPEGYEETMPIIDALWIKEFEVKIVSDNANVNNTKDDVDIVYASAEDETFQKEKEVTFKINTALTAKERQDLGLTATVMRCNPLDSTDDLLTSVYDRVSGNGECKPEELYVDAAYREHSRVRLDVELEMQSKTSGMNLWRRLYLPIKQRSYWPWSISDDLMKGTQKIKVREC